jgi:hypothetical protein
MSDLIFPSNSDNYSLLVDTLVVLLLDNNDNNNDNNDDDDYDDDDDDDGDDMRSDRSEINLSNHPTFVFFFHFFYPQTEYLQRKNLTSASDLIAHFDHLNSQLSQHDFQYWGYAADKSGNSKSKSEQNAKLNAINKATKFKFYLGMSKLWLHE